MASGLTSITIPNGVTRIGDSAFLYAKSLTSVTIPSSVTSIGIYAFNDASKLASVRFLGNAPAIGIYSFTGVSSSAKVYRFATATGFGDFASAFKGLPQSPLVLPPETLVATAGTASATITVTSPPSLGPAPSSYTISATSDATKTCVITGSTGSCKITGLKNGTPYTFTAVAYTTTPAGSSIVSAASNQVTPHQVKPNKIKKN
jgi:hypothetical protein